MKKLLTLLLLLGPFFSSLLFAQGEGNNWYFGQFAAITFETSPPTVLNNSAMFSFEGCATISDSDGNLLFYTDGLTVFNSVHEIMENGEGLQGGSSSTQSAIIVPMPGSETIYYVFTVLEFGLNGMSYSVVDMTLDGGLGAVTAEKNILLNSDSSERITAVRHDNGQDLWIINASFTTNKFYSFLLDDTGINTTAVESTAGIEPNDFGIGYLKSSFDGEMLVCCHALGLGDNLDILSFNGQTGVVSELMTLSCDPMTPYGVEFSPDQSKLYVGGIDEGQISGALIQFDLTDFNETSVQNSKVTLFETEEGLFVGAVQRGPDDLLYVANTNSFLGAIQNPNAVCLACDFDPEYLDLTPGTCSFGLPNFLPSFFIDASLSASQFCFGNPTLFLIEGAPEEAVVNWNFGDTNSPSNTATGFEVSHVYSAGGTYTATATVVFEGEETEYTIEVNIFQPTLDIVVTPSETGLAPLVVDFNFNASGQNLQLDFQNDGTFDYSTSAPFESTSFTYVNPGVYLAVATVSLEGCVAEDSVFIRVYTEPSLFIPNVITPNGDSKNNSFYVKGSGISEIELFIYNRWGALVGELNEIDDIFEPTDSFETWQPNDEETSGTYMYFYKAKGFEGQELEGTGTLTVLGLK